MDQKYSYLVGALLQANTTPQMEQEKLNQCAQDGWELLTVIVKKHQGNDYVFYYFKKPFTGEETKPRFDKELFHFSS